MNPASLNFDNQPVSTSSSPRSVTLTNSGNAALNLTSIAVTGANAADFALSPTGGTPCSFGASSLGAGNSCTFNVTFTPGATGARVGNVTVTSNASSSPHNGALSGTGTAPAVSLSPSPVAFGNQPVGTASSPHTITLTNSGSATLHITSIGVTGTNAADFALSPAGGTPCSFGAGSLAAGSSCTFNVTFTPASAGSRASNVTVTSDAASSPHNVPLSGTGAASAPAVSLSPSPVAFGNQPVGTASSPHTITLTNSGNATLGISSIAVIGANAGDFALSPTGGTPCSFGASSLGAGNSCTLNVTFTPGGAGARAANITVASNASSSPNNDALSGAGTATGVALLPSPVAFGNQKVGSASRPQIVTLANSGNATLNISSIGVTGANAADFALSPTGSRPCSLGASTLAPGSSCTFNVTFTPAAAGARAGNVRVTSNAASSPDNDPLSGTGLTPAGVSLSTTSLAFGNQRVGTASSPLGVTLTNNGGTQLNISSLALGGANPADFAKSDTCGASVAAGASCTIRVTFSPTAAGARSAGVTIIDDAAGSPQTITLSGTGTASALLVSPASVSFGNQNVGTSSPASSITLTNSGSSPLTISGISITGPHSADFSITSACPTAPAALAAGSNCSISFIFKPTAPGSRSATVSIADNAQGNPHSFTLSGIGVDFAPVLSGPASARVAPGQAAVFNISLGTQGGPLAAAVTFACSNLPARTLCSFNPAMIPAGSTAASTTLTVSTTGPTARLAMLNPPAGIPINPSTPSRGRIPAAFLLVSALAALGMWRFGQAPTRDLHQAYAVLALLLVLAVFQAGCVGVTGGTPPPASGGTPPGTSTIIVTATSGGVSHSMTITLTISSGFPGGGAVGGAGGTRGDRDRDRGRSRR
ncbi:MAG: choice-of-anchor D domain-containing protein [Acidobacteria bacterium]|nr:choice-of-anchor D domain-containing protein [Acidobacteriota bacterium]